MNISIPVENSIEIIELTSINPLISKCKIKVCYVGDEPNRNRSIITKDVAKQIANTLPGSPIVGYYNETAEDFEEHNEIFRVKNGKLVVSTNTRPYGFVDLKAQAWFEKYVDNGIEHEYLVTEGYLWTGQFPEAKKIIEEGRPQSLEFDKDNNTLNAFWTKDNNGKKQFFIINEAVISKLCVLGDDVEPCFEGASVTNFSLSLEEDFKQTMFSLIKDMQNILEEGGKHTMETITNYAVEIGDTLWSLIYSNLEKSFPDTTKDYECSIYGIVGVYEENSSKFVIVRNREENTYHKITFNYTEEGFEFTSEPVLVEATFIEVNAPAVTPEAVTEYEMSRYAKKDDDDEEKKKDEESSKEEEEEKEESSEEDPDDEEEKKKKTSYSLDDVTEYQELLVTYNNLVQAHEELQSNYSKLESENANLLQFKNETEKVEKENLIAEFTMLSDEDKQDVVENISTYSLEEIEAKLSVICRRKKVSFALDNEIKDNNAPTTYNLNDGMQDDVDNKPSWLKAVDRNMKKNYN